MSYVSIFQQEEAVWNDDECSRKHVKQTIAEKRNMYDAKLLLSEDCDSYGICLKNQCYSISTLEILCLLSDH